MTEIEKVRAAELGEKLGLKVSFDNKESGVLINENGKMTKREFEEYFSELTNRS